MKEKFVNTLIILVVLSFSTASYALGKSGHRVLCQLSYDLLAPEQQAKLDRLLQALPHGEKQRINQYNYQNKEQVITFANSCTWADAIKKDSSYDKYKPWHYLNVDRQKNTIDNKSCSSDCLTKAISHHSKQLSSNVSQTEKAKALMFLGHWLGDIHQPLHVSFASDLGGNKVAVEPFIGRCNNLHWYWDQCLLLSRNKGENEKSSSYYSAMYHQLYQRLTDQLIAMPKEVEQIGSVTSWANESFSLIRQSNFKYCQLKDKECKQLTEEKIVVTKAYHREFSQILQQQIIKGAIRLSGLINKHL